MTCVNHARDTSTVRLKSVKAAPGRIPRRSWCLPKASVEQVEREDIREDSDTQDSQTTRRDASNALGELLPPTVVESKRETETPRTRIKTEHTSSTL